MCRLVPGAGELRSFAQQAVAVGDHEFFQSVGTGRQFISFFCVGDEAWLRVFAYSGDGGHDISVILNDLFDGFEMMVFGEGHAFGRQDEGVAAVAIDLREGAIDGDSIAAVFDGSFPAGPAHDR